MTIYLSAVGSGLGDIIVLLPVLQQLIATGEPIYLIAKSPRQENLESLLPGLAGTIREPDFDERAAQGRYYNFRSHPIQRDYDWASEEFYEAFPGIRINGIFEIICKDFGLPVEFNRPLVPLPYNFLSEWAETIVFIPGTVIDTKCWTVPRWLELYGALQDKSQSVLMIGEPDRSPSVKQLQDLQIPWVATPSITQVLDIVSTCRAVVSVDTGIMHLSVHQGKPTIALFEHPPLYYRPYPNCLPLFAAPCSKECIEARVGLVDRTERSEQWQWYQGKFERCVMSAELKCMSSITVEAVLSALNGAPAQITERTPLKK
jgi:ADP-heptose:LPS heptosyltransferase